MNSDETLRKGDQLVEQGSLRLRQLSEKAAARGGLAAKLAQPLAEDAAFLRKLKPSLIKARASGTAEPETAASAPPPAPAPEPSTSREAVNASDNRDPRGARDERNPIPLIGAALGAGIATAKLLDWRGHAHPRD
jgi:hypothetical protein